MKEDFVFVSESVTEGHPDKLCDRVSDAVLDACLQADPFSQMVVECAIATGVLFIAARSASRGRIDIPSIARQVISEVGYVDDDFNAETCSIMTNLTELPLKDGARIDERTMSEKDIARRPASNGVTVFGFACRQTSSLMPLPVTLAHRLARGLVSARVKGNLPYLMPDGTTQVGIEYRKRRPHRIHSVSLITALDREAAPASGRLHDDLMAAVVEPSFAGEALRPDQRTKVFVNPGGAFFTGGPTTHSGLTGRKNAIDTYGEFARHSGAALSGKDPTRIDRVGAYAARFAAKNVVAAGLAEECEVQLSYTIGLSRPVSVQVETFGTSTLDDETIARRLEERVDFRPAGIIRAFNLRHLPSSVRGGFYRRLAAYGHVGRMEMGLPWEVVDPKLDLSD